MNKSLKNTPTIIHHPYKNFTLTILALSIVLIRIVLTGHLTNIHRVKLANRALRFIDGIPFGVDAQAIQSMLRIRKKIHEMQYGSYNNEKKKYIGHYIFENKKCTLKDLVILEKKFNENFAQKKKILTKNHLNVEMFKYDWSLCKAKLEQELQKKISEQEIILFHHHNKEEQQLLDEHTARLEKEQKKIKKKYMKNPTQYNKNLKTLNREYAKKIGPLITILKKVKKELMTVTKPFLEQARSAKEFLLPLMKEWAVKAGRPFSPLLRWHDDDNKNEIERFKQNVNSFYRVDEFCTDLVNFNESIIYSCPRGYKQFIKQLSSFIIKIT